MFDDDDYCTVCGDIIDADGECFCSLDELDNYTDDERDEFDIGYYELHPEDHDGSDY